MLYIVDTCWVSPEPVKNLPNDDNIIYPENIKVLSYETFSDFLNLKGETREHFNEIIELNYNTDIDELRNIHESNQVIWNNKDDLRRELKQKRLINRNINEYLDNF